MKRIANPQKKPCGFQIHKDGTKPPERGDSMVELVAFYIVLLLEMPLYVGCNSNWWRLKGINAYRLSKFNGKSLLIFIMKPFCLERKKQKISCLRGFSVIL
jgi:hypothetical protein